MIEPLPGRPAQPHRSRLHTLSPLPSAGDSYVPAAQPQPVIPKSPLPQAREAYHDGPGVLSRALLTSCLAIGAVSGLLAAYPAMAQVQVVPVKPSNNAAVRQLVASSLVTNRTPPGTVEQRLAQLRPEVRAKLQSLPTAQQKAYVDLDVSGRRWLAGQIAGSTDTYLGKVKNRPAFVSGRVLFINLFNVVKGQIKDEVKKGTIPREAQPRINAYLDSLKQLQPAQREALAQALETEFPKGR